MQNLPQILDAGVQFESFVNSERCKTLFFAARLFFCLRALLIQKDAKLHGDVNPSMMGLRALLIQKDAKQLPLWRTSSESLRALLIQKDAKHDMIESLTENSLRALLIQKDAKPRPQER